jgi:hypothetical protein
VGEAKYLDLAGCAELLDLPVRRLRKVVRSEGFPAPAGEDGASYWLDRDVFVWAAAQGPLLASRVPLRYWPQAGEPAEFLGSTRVAARYGADDVALRWAAGPGTVAVIWRPDGPIMMSLRDLMDDIDAKVLVGVDPDFGIWGPGVRSLNRARHGKDDPLSWPDLARVLGQPMPYWPYALRDPDLIEVWQPGAPTITAPARPDLDSVPLLRMAAMFDPGHATHQTLMNLVRVDQERATRSAVQDLEIASECTQRWTDRHDEAITVTAAQPLVIGDLDVDAADIQASTRRIGWLELLPRTDTLSWECVRQALAWDGGRHFPFSSPEEVDPDCPHGREWIARLEPAKIRTAEFAHIDHGGAGEPLVDPMTGAPAVRLSGGRVVTSVPQRLPTTSDLAELVLDRSIWIRTADGTLYLAPKHHYYEPRWGYGGTGPGVLALLIHHLLDDITAELADGINGAPAGLEDLAQLEWPHGTILTRDLLQAARDGRRYNHPDKP